MKTDDNRQAVVIIHGIGEQKPMSTLRGFVSTMTNSITENKNAIKFFSKPDTLSNSFELRRLTTPPKGSRLKTDFFEYYWAYNLRDTKVMQVLKWVTGILLRWPWKLPKRIVGFQIFIWLLIIACALIFIKGQAMWSKPSFDSFWFGIGLSVFTSLITYLVVGYLGDAARYTSANPENIAERQKIRQDGIQLLRSLHQSKKYKKIIIIGHSLGSIIGYDIIRNLWSEFNIKYQDTLDIHSIPNFENDYTSPIKFEIDAYQTAQGKLLKQQNADGNNWLITDFITLGSPLTYSAFLMAKNKEELKLRIGERELPSSPPVSEDLTDGKRFSYTPDKDEPNRVLHHAASFACTKWTNIYYRNDLVGGELKECYGLGIRDIPISINNNFFLEYIPFLSHTHYWSDSNSGYEKCRESSQIIKSIIGFDN